MLSDCNRRAIPNQPEKKDPRRLHQRNMRKKRNDNAENSINSQERISFPNLDQLIFSERKTRDEREKGWTMKEGGEGYFTVRRGS